MVALADSLASALAKVPGKHAYMSQVVRSAPRRSYALFPHATDQTVKIWQEEVLVVLSEGDLPVAALEANIYTIPATATCLVYVSKVDTSGLAETRPSPTRALAAAFVAHHLAHPPHGSRRVRVHVFARAQGQYLFPGSVDNKAKRVLDDKALIRWWRATLSMAVKSLSSLALKEQTRLFYQVPGMSYLESLPYVPASSDPDYPKWTYNHPYSSVSSPLYASSSTASHSLADLIPNFPDDPKARFLTSLTSSTVPPAGSEDDYDELTQAIHARSLLSSASSDGVTAATLERDRATERGRLANGVPGGVDEFWERLAFRQECSSGALVAFFAVVLDRPDERGEAGAGTEVKAEVEAVVEADDGKRQHDKGKHKPKATRGALDHNVFTRLWSEFHNVDYAVPVADDKAGRERVAAAARKWIEDVETVVRVDGSGPQGPLGEDEDEAAYKARKREIYDWEVCRVVTVDNPPLPDREGQKRPIEEGVRVNVMVPRKKKPKPS